MVRRRAAFHPSRCCARQISCVAVATDVRTTSPALRILMGRAAGNYKPSHKPTIALVLKHVSNYREAGCVPLPPPSLLPVLPHATIACIAFARSPRAPLRALGSGLLPRGRPLRLALAAAGFVSQQRLASVDLPHGRHRAPHDYPRQHHRRRILLRKRRERAALRTPVLWLQQVAVNDCGALQAHDATTCQDLTRSDTI